MTRGTSPPMDVHRPGDEPLVRVPEPSFAGDVRIGGYQRRAAPSRLVSATVAFAPGARTPWKVNPFGQMVIVTSGFGWAQSGDGAIMEIRAGDTLWFPPGERHWEGATTEQAMVYVAVQEEGGTDRVRFVAEVTDEEYRVGPDGLAP